MKALELNSYKKTYKLRSIYNHHTKRILSQNSKSGLKQLKHLFTVTKKNLLGLGEVMVR